MITPNALSGGTEGRSLLRFTSSDTAVNLSQDLFVGASQAFSGGPLTALKQPARDVVQGPTNTVLLRFCSTRDYLGHLSAEEEE